MRVVLLSGLIFCGLGFGVDLSAFNGIEIEEQPKTLSEIYELHSAKEIDQWCEDQYVEATELFKANQPSKAHHTLAKILTLRPNHTDALRRIGFIPVEGGIRPSPSKLISNGWMLTNGTWTPRSDFNHDLYESVSKKVRASVKKLAPKLGSKNDSARNELIDFKEYVSGIGVTAMPALVSLARKGSTSKERALAYAALAPLKPEHLKPSLIERYPQTKNEGLAASMGATLAQMSGGSVPKSIAKKLVNGSNDEALRAAQLAALVGDKKLVPLIRNRWVKIREELITQPGGSRNMISILSQRAYIRDLTAVVGVQVGLFDPDIGYIQSGGVFDVRVVKVEIFRTVLQKLTGAPGLTPEDFDAINEEVFK